ncbi:MULTISPECIES: alpha/beta hydrolase [Streptomyces]|uniref:alpha/beta hydrolase n=1 Tax=Streptomyces TaxID=1883 RepID=UPI001316A04B|nr:MULTISPECIES: alpha/beta hydrolase [Streptomyces]QGZ50751.1 alpha/beta hydrolase fold domain-containing protein [Streptomyces sp. QHH-9511]GGT82878.1 esterase [Streptomyces lateritius]
MPLDPTYAMIRRYREVTGFTPLYKMSVEEARRADAETEAANWDWHEHPEEVFDVDFTGSAGRQTVRVYRPQSDEPLPMVLYFNGGGFVVGSLSTSDSICRALATMVPCVVVSVGYRLAPEHPFPAAVDDCYTAVKWAADHAAEFGADSRRIAVAGDSAGGNLAAAMALMARDKNGPELSAQVLVYPPLHNNLASKSMRENKDPMFFNAHSSAWFWNHYLANPTDGDSPYASPLKAADHSGLPAALILTAELCPVRDEGEAYANALSAAGVPVEHHDYAGLPHGFLAVAAKLQTSRDALALIAGYLRQRLGVDPRHSTDDVVLMANQRVPSGA